MANKKKKLSLEEINPLFIKKFKELRRSCGLRKFNSHKDRSYIQLKNESSNLVIRVFQQNSNQHEQFKDIVYQYEHKHISKPSASDEEFYSAVLKEGHSESDIDEMTDEEWQRILKKTEAYKQYKKEYDSDEERYEKELKAHTHVFKEKMKDAFTAWINELELMQPTNGKASNKSIKISTNIKNQQKQELKVSVSVNQTLENIFEYIKSNEPDEEKIKEAEKQLGVLKDEVKKKKPRWSKIKKVLEWSLNFGRDVFIKLIPILLEKYG